ncbi:MAG TPA: ATPase, T2SS/T4P/T4SS family [Candidatus Polarisedimenticolaceae bacterium]|nr:ATPase, T2SS/T4P/T4SS family [Candidatus Polarisedimenticolaceae bacterium]
MRRSPSLGDVLLQAKVIDAVGLARVLETHSRDGGSVAKIVADLGLAAEEVVCRAIADGLGLGYVSFSDELLPSIPAAALPAGFCRERKIVPLGIDGRQLRLAMADPLDQSTIQDAEFRTSKWVVPIVATESAIVRALDRLHPEAAETGTIAYEQLANAAPEGELEAASDPAYEVVDPAQLAKDVDLPPIVRLVNMLLTDAAKAGASDIHIEPHEQGLQVRHRLDGILHDVTRIPPQLQQSTVSRLKIISGMDIAERRKPQDGRSRLRVDQRRVELRVSTLPTSFGEKVVIRLLDNTNAQIELERLGFAPDLLRTLRELLSRPQGMILVTGPTGSGKTSTLYAALNWMKSRTKNIITVEDPIEYQLRGINQVQINARAGVTFASGLRSILRQDPNIVLVGEIRDQETANIALEASQTGHLLLSTLHTNDAPSSITRLVDLGIEPFLVASSIIGILAQRLVRRPCAACSTERAPAPGTLERLGAYACPPDGRWIAGSGCEKCHQSGYLGRLAIHELLVISDELRELISARAPEHQLRVCARRAGMRTMMEDGIDKAAHGLTTLEEALRVAPPDEAREPEAPVAAVVEAPPATAADGERARGRILIVEDSATVSTVVKYFLELEGFEVVVAEDGLTGLEWARRDRPDLVVSDLHMPGLDGIALVEALRAAPETREVAIVVLTAETSIDVEARGLAIGADDYLTKPVEPKRLAARVKAVLARTRARQRAAS